VWALLQGLLLLPTILGSICFHDSLGPSWEWKPCACTILPAAAGGAPSVVAIDRDECGPCHDHACSALRSAPISGGRWKAAAVLPAISVPQLAVNLVAVSIAPTPWGTGPPQSVSIALRC
jgi:hypothetical protein